MTAQSGPNGQIGILAIAANRNVVRRATIMALIVGTILAAINHGDSLLAGAVSGTDVVKILMTYLVPYGVSTVSSVLTVRDQMRELQARVQGGSGAGRREP